MKKLVAVRIDVIDAMFNCSACGKKIRVTYSVSKKFTDDISKYELDNEHHVETLCEKCLQHKGFKPVVFINYLRRGKGLRGLR